MNTTQSTQNQTVNTKKTLLTQADKRIVRWAWRSLEREQITWEQYEDIVSVYSATFVKNALGAMFVRDAYRKKKAKEITFDQYDKIIQPYSSQFVLDVLRPIFDAEERLKKYKQSDRYLFRIRKYCNRRYWTDVDPYEVVRVISPKIVEVRGMRAELVKAPQEFYPGGFSGHYADNYSQKWEYFSDPEAPTFRIHLGSKGWGKGNYTMSDNPRKFYDYNF